MRLFKFALALALMIGVAFGAADMGFTNLDSTTLVYDFGAVTVDSTDTDTVYFKSVGEDTLSISAMALSDTTIGFTATCDSTIPFLVAPDDSVAVYFLFTSWHRGSYETTYNVTSNDSDRTSISITLQAQAEHADSMVIAVTDTFNFGDSLGIGGDDERPLHAEPVDSFYVSRYEVTVVDYRDFVNDTSVTKRGFLNNRKVLNAGDNDCPLVYSTSADSFEFEATDKAPDSLGPMIEITWQGAIEYCNWLSVENSLTPCYTWTDSGLTWHTDSTGYRLPTEVEWEYAAKAGKGYKYSGTTPDALLGYYAVYKASEGNKTFRCGSLYPNDFGLYDMSGNVWEFVWPVEYEYSADTTVTVNTTTDFISVRGGSWIDRAYRCRTSERFRYPLGSNSITGFRTAKNN